VLDPLREVAPVVGLDRDLALHEGAERVLDDLALRRGLSGDGFGHGVVTVLRGR